MRLAESLAIEVASVGTTDKEAFSTSCNQQNIDLSVLQGLREIASTDQVAQLIGLFLDTLGRNLSAMRAAMVEGDTTALAKLAHGSKGTAAGMGATSLAALSRELEVSAKHGMLEEVYAWFHQMESETQRVAQIFEKEKTAPSNLR